MTYFPACAGSEEEGPTNFTPPAMGAETRRLMESRRKLSVLDKLTRETAKFHETMALKHGLNTTRGLAHYRIAKAHREAKTKLQEFIDDPKRQVGGDHSELGELDPKAIIAANTASVKFHKQSADKAGLDTDEGHAHVAAMEHHADIIKQAQQLAKGKKQSEGGPGSGPRKGSGGGQKKQQKIGLATSEVQQQGKSLAYDLSKNYGLPTIANTLSSMMDKGADSKEIEGLADFVSSAQRGPKYSEEDRQDVASKLYKLAEWAERARSKDNPKKEAKFGHSSKKSPFPGVPRKKDIPNEDIHQDKPALPLRKLQQQKASQYLAPRYEKSHEGGPGSGPRKGQGKSSGTEKMTKVEKRTRAKKLADYDAIRNFARVGGDVKTASQHRRDKVNRLRMLANRFERAGNKPDALKMKNRINALLGESEKSHQSEGGPGSGPQHKMDKPEELARSAQLIKDPSGKKVLQKRAQKMRSQMLADLGRELSTSRRGKRSRRESLERNY